MSDDHIIATIEARDNASFPILRAMVEMILRFPEHHEWTLQGLGMLRCYIRPDMRLHVWDQRFAAPDATQLHTHPWHFTSLVIAGVVTNVRYSEMNDGDPGVAIADWDYLKQEILCGEGGGESGEAVPVRLYMHGPEIYGAGHSYAQQAHEIHESHPEDGTVTIITRDFLDDADHACVYYKPDAGWVSAEPRPATDQEVDQICTNALERFFT